MIVLNVMAGLCNRLQAISSGIRLAKFCDERLKVVWENDFHMDTLFSELFAKTECFDLEEHRKETLLNKVVFSKFNPFYRSMEQDQFFLAECLEGDSRLIFHKTWRAFYRNEDYSWLSPVSTLKNRIDAMDVLPRGAIGVHIRRTDNRAAIRCSPTRLFVERIERDLRLNPTQSYFVCSDDRQVKDELLNRFGEERIRTRKDVIARKEDGGVADAVVDLFLLSQTEKIYGSYPSSFSDVAAQIGGIKLEWVRLPGVN